MSPVSRRVYAVSPILFFVSVQMIFLTYVLTDTIVYNVFWMYLLKAGTVKFGCGNLKKKLSRNRNIFLMHKAQCNELLYFKVNYYMGKIQVILQKHIPALKRKSHKLQKRSPHIVHGLKIIYFTNNQLPEIIIQTALGTKRFLCFNEISVTLNAYSTITVIQYML